MEISVRHSPLPPQVVRHLISNDILLVSHLNHFTPMKLSEKLGYSLSKCEQILSITKPKKPHHGVTAAELAMAPFEVSKTAFDKLDWLIGDGIQTGRITEVSGEAGSGKSHLCAQLSLLAQLPVEHGGMNCEVLLINTEGEGKLKLALRRFFKIAKSLLEEHDLQFEMTPTKMQDSIFVMSATDENSLSNVIFNKMESFLKDKPNVKLVIIDSITSPFSCEQNILPANVIQYYCQRGAKLTHLVKTMSRIAWDYRVAFVITNHVSYDPKLGYNTPAMGKLWAQMCHTKIYLERRDSCGETGTAISRYAHVTKGAAHPSEPVAFSITNNFGLRETNTFELVDIDHLIMNRIFENEEEEHEYSEFERCTQLLYNA